MILEIGLASICLIVASVLTAKAVRAKRQNKLLASLAEKARERLAEDLGVETEVSGEIAISNALEMGNEIPLRALANLIGQRPSHDIIMAAFVVAYMNVEFTESIITPDSITSEQVRVFTEVSHAVDDEINLESILDNDANRIAYYAMEHLSDYPMILSIVTTRGINKLDQIKSMMIEMKDSGSGALTEGTL